MTPEQITLVKDSWSKVRAETESMAAVFYRKLFELAPELQALFLGDMTIQQAKLNATLDMIVFELDMPARLSAKIQALGRLHGHYGVKPEHYRLVETALLAAFREILGSQFDDQTETAWREAYQRLASAMIDAEIDSAVYLS